jgi:hypothetical protein
MNRVNLASPPYVLVQIILVVFITWFGHSTLAQQTAAPPLTIQQSEVYVCPMHMGVQSKTPGKCPKCGMSLLKQPPGVAGEYEVVLKTTPTVVKSGEKVKLDFIIFHPKTQEQAKQFNIVHEKLFHLFIVSQDLEHFQHIHPIQQSDGTFVVETVLPKPGLYKVFCDFFPVGGTPQVVRKSLNTTGFTDSITSSNAKLLPDQDLTKSVDGIRFEVTINPPDLVSGELTHLNYHLVDERSGQPVNDLQPYLGAWGHTFVLSEDTTDSLHAHPDKMIPDGIDRSKLAGGADVSFETFFRRPGRYRIWSQFQRKDKVTTVSLTVEVWQLDKVTKWDGSSWSALPGTSKSDLKRTVHAIAVSGSDVYVGGDFTSIDGVSANRIAKWDGRRWSALGGGISNGIVYAIAVSGPDVYVGGTFTAASGVKANRMAKWDGHTWSALGGGINGCKDPYCSPTAYAIAVSGSDIYVGGQFTRAGEVNVEGIAKWNRSSWSALGRGVRAEARDGIVMTLAVSKGEVYAGGKFITAGEMTANNIAKWSGTSWSALGSGIRGDMERVRAIAISGEDVYAGGAFSSAGGVSAHNIGKWNGRSWSVLEIDPDEVYAIAISGSDIYVTGNLFRIPGQATVRGIVRWDGKSWSALGKGIHLMPVLATRVSGRAVYVGGD